MSSAFSDNQYELFLRQLAADSGSGQAPISPLNTAKHHLRLAIAKIQKQEFAKGTFKNSTAILSTIYDEASPHVATLNRAMDPEGEALVEQFKQLGISSLDTIQNTRNVHAQPEGRDLKKELLALAQQDDPTALNRFIMDNDYGLVDVGGADALSHAMRYAAAFGRHRNIPVLIAQGGSSLSIGKESESLPIHHALKGLHIECVRVLLDSLSSHGWFFCDVSQILAKKQGKDSLQLLEEMDFLSFTDGQQKRYIAILQLIRQHLMHPVQYVGSFGAAELAQAFKKVEILIKTAELALQLPAGVKSKPVQPKPQAAQPAAASVLPAAAAPAPAAAASASSSANILNALSKASSSVQRPQIVEQLLTLIKEKDVAEVRGFIQKHADILKAKRIAGLHERVWDLALRTSVQFGRFHHLEILFHGEGNPGQANVLSIDKQSEQIVLFYAVEGLQVECVDILLNSPNLMGKLCDLEQIRWPASNGDTPIDMLSKINFIQLKPEAQNRFMAIVDNFRQHLTNPNAPSKYQDSCPSLLAELDKLKAKSLQSWAGGQHEHAGQASYPPGGVAVPSFR